MEQDDILQIGGSIELTGFDVVNAVEMAVLRKIMSNHLRKYEELCKKFGGLKIRMKPLHHTEERTKKFDVHAQLFDEGKIYTASTNDHELFRAVDAVLNKLSNELS